MHHLALTFVLPFGVSLCCRLPLPAAFTWYMNSAGKKIPSPCHLGLPSSGHQSLKCCAVPCLVTQSCGTLCNLMDCSLPESSVHGDSPGKNTGLGCHALLQRIFPTQGLNPGLPHCGQFLYCLSHQGSPRILEWVPYPFSRGTSRPRIEPGSPA